MNNMFDLEQSIADWRNQMLAAGIKAPVPLDELEIHLREEIERQMKSGLSEKEIFNSAVQKIGQPHLLKTEFKKAGYTRPFIKAHRTLGILWMALCGYPSIWTLGCLLQVRNFHPAVISTIDFDLTILFCLLAFAGAAAGLPLFCGAKWAHRFFSLVAVLSVIATIMWVAVFGSLSMFIVAFDFLSLASVVLLLMEHIAKGLERRQTNGL